MCRIILASFLFLTLFNNCTSRQPARVNEEMAVEEEAVLPYVMNLESIHKDKGVLHLSDVAEEVLYIPLETTDEVLLKRVSHVAILDSTLFVGDFNNLYQFDMSGKFIRKIGTHGEGPSEYRMIFSIMTNKPSHSMYMITQTKIHQYDSDGALIKTISTKDTQPLIYDGNMISEDKFLIYIGTQYKSIDDTTTVYSYVEIDTLGQVHRKIARHDPIIATYSGMLVAFNMYKYHDRVHFLDYGTDTLYRYSVSDGKQPYAICELGTMKCPANTTGLKSKQEEDALLSKLRIDQITEDNRMIYIQLAWGLHGDPLYSVYDKATKELTGLGADGIVNDLDGGPFFFPDYTENDGLKIAWKDAADFKESVLSLDYALQKSKYGSKFESLYQLGTSVNEDDNPILIIAK
jgi:hypothetical protein